MSADDRPVKVDAHSERLLLIDARDQAFKQPLLSIDAFDLDNGQRLTAVSAFCVSDQLHATRSAYDISSLLKNTGLIQANVVSGDEVVAKLVLSVHELKTCGHEEFMRGGTCHCVKGHVRVGRTCRHKGIIICILVGCAVLALFSIYHAKKYVNGKKTWNLDPNALEFSNPVTILSENKQGPILKGRMNATEVVIKPLIVPKQPKLVWPRSFAWKRHSGAASIAELELLPESERDVEMSCQRYATLPHVNGNMTTVLFNAHDASLKCKLKTYFLAQSMQKRMDILV